MIYPQCFSGKMIPYVNSQGFLAPCCQLRAFSQKIISIDDTLIDNPFYDEDFSLYKKSYLEIVNNKKWDDLIDSLHYTKIKRCHRFCGHKNESISSALKIIGDNKPIYYSPDKMHTKDIKHIQLETTNRCNLNCRYCSRFTTAKSELNNRDLPLFILEDVLKSKHWIDVDDCGSYGDSIFYKHYHEFLQLLSVCVIDYYKISIAATGKSKKWWDITQNLWKQLNDSGIRVVIFWGIDGLEETSKIHRENQDWEEIFENMKISSYNGIESVWQFIPFSFNEHQIETAKKIANDIGVTFYLKPSDRFKKEDDWKPKSQKFYYIVENQDQKHVIKNSPDIEWIVSDKVHKQPKIN